MTRPRKRYGIERGAASRVPEMERDLAFAKDEVVVLALAIDMAPLIDRLPEVGQPHEWIDKLRASTDIDDAKEVLLALTKDYSGDEAAAIWRCFHKHYRSPWTAPRKGKGMRRANNAAPTNRT